jgi:hypothetical protein
MATASRIPMSVDGTTSVPSEWFVARITEVGASTIGTASCVGYPHSWIEQQICGNGYDYEDMPSSIARVGKIQIIVDGVVTQEASQQAFALDGSQSSVGAIVLMRPRSIGADDSTLFEFFKSGGGGGPQWFSGSGAPSSETGSDGDFYLDITNGNIYNKIDGVWVLMPKTDCPHVSSVQCTGGLLIVTYDTTCVGA